MNRLKIFPSNARKSAKPLVEKFVTKVETVNEDSQFNKDSSQTQLPCLKMWKIWGSMDRILY